MTLLGAVPELPRSLPHGFHEVNMSLPESGVTVSFFPTQIIHPLFSLQVFFSWGQMIWMTWNMVYLEVQNWWKVVSSFLLPGQVLYNFRICFKMEFIIECLRWESDLHLSERIFFFLSDLPT